MTNPTQVSNPNSIKPDAVVAAFTGAIRASSLHANQNTFGGYAKPMKDEPFVLSKISAGSDQPSTCCRQTSARR